VATQFVYDIAADFPVGKVNLVRLKQEIEASSITIALGDIGSVGGVLAGDVLTGGSLTVTFKADLSPTDKATLDGDTAAPAGGLIAAHDNTPTPSTMPKLDEEGVTLSKPQPQDVGYEMCDRDFKIVTCKVSQAAAVEDLKQDPVTLREVAWTGPELKIVGVYKDAGPGALVSCVDQADADLNGILSVFDYKAYDQADGVTMIPYNIRSGSLVSDPAIDVAAVPAARFQHRAYLIAAPDLGQPYFVRTFDGYVAGRPNAGELSTESPTAKKLDPALVPGVSNVLRLYVHHPAGQSNSHILWLLTYRPSGTF